MQHAALTLLLCYMLVQVLVGVTSEPLRGGNVSGGMCKSRPDRQVTPAGTRNLRAWHSDSSAVLSRPKHHAKLSACRLRAIAAVRRVALVVESVESPHALRRLLACGDRVCRADELTPSLDGIRP